MDTLVSCEYKNVRYRIRKPLSIWDMAVHNVFVFSFDRDGFEEMGNLDLAQFQFNNYLHQVISEQYEL